MFWYNYIIMPSIFLAVQCRWFKYQARVGWIRYVLLMGNHNFQCISISHITNCRGAPKIHNISVINSPIFTGVHCRKFALCTSSRAVDDSCCSIFTGNFRWCFSYLTTKLCKSICLHYSRRQEKWPKRAGNKQKILSQGQIVCSRPYT